MLNRHGFIPHLIPVTRSVLSLFPNGGYVAAPVAAQLDTASQQACQMDATQLGYFSTALGYTTRFSFQLSNSSGTDYLLGVTNGPSDRGAIVVDGSDVRCRAFDGGTTKVKSGSIGVRTGIHQIVMTNDPIGDSIRAWLDGVELTGGNSAVVSGTVGGFLGASSNGGDFGTTSMTGLIWGYELWRQTITDLSDLGSLVSNRKFSFTQATPTTALDERGTGGLMTLANGASFTEIPT